MARFDNKVVLVSGGARGQGAAEARLLVAQGAKVVIGDVLDNQGQSLAVELGPAASFVRHDVTSEADWARSVEAAQKLGGLHGLVNNAGIYQPAALMETDDAHWQRHIQINQYGCFLGMQAVVPAMERSGGGSIVNISSVAGLKGSPGSFAYAATKWGAAGYDQVGSDRPRQPQNPGELGSSRSHRHGHDRVPHARAARGADEAGADAPLRNARGGRTAGGVPALRREELHHRGEDRHRRRFIGLDNRLRLDPTDELLRANSRFAPLTGHSGRPSQRH